MPRGKPKTMHQLCTITPPDISSLCPKSKNTASTGVTLLSAVFQIFLNQFLLFGCAVFGQVGYHSCLFFLVKGKLGFA